MVQEERCILLKLELDIFQIVHNSDWLFLAQLPVRVVAPFVCTLNSWCKAFWLIVRALVTNGVNLCLKEGKMPS